MSDRTLLVVDDDSDIRAALIDTLEDAGFRVIGAENGEAALRILERTTVDLVVTDVQMEPLNGIELLARIRETNAALPVVLMTAFGTIQQAVDSMRDGASHYLVKPFEVHQLLSVIERFLPSSAVAGRLIAEDAHMKELVRTAALVALSDATVTISGESGTGKEVFARLIHDSSPRAAKPFVAINCAAIPENMLEAVLFGHVKGAYTGALRDNPGKFEQAQQGTLLLDEISEMDLGLQAKLLRVLQEREVERIGSNKAIALDVRVIATTNRDLRAEVSAGRFREDLFYRLNVFPLNLPPLRERRADIEPLARFALQKYWHSGKPMPEMTGQALQALCEHTWPGNVRELDNVIQRCLILCQGGPIARSHLCFECASGAGTDVPAASADGALHDALMTHEQQLIIDTLVATTGNRTRAAERLGISQRTLRYKLARLREAGVTLPRANTAAAV